LSNVAQMARLVTVYQIRSAQVSVEVDDEATEEQIEEAARKRVEESDWSTLETLVMTIVCEPSLSWKVFLVGRAYETSPS
jgi:elongation factor P--beta-lysine ligase